MNRVIRRRGCDTSQLSGGATLMPGSGYAWVPRGDPEGRAGWCSCGRPAPVTQGLPDAAVRISSSCKNQTHSRPATFIKE